MLFGQFPTYAHLKTFGCLCFASTLTHQRHKFAHRAQKCIFPSYPYGIKGYKVLDFNTNIMFVSRNVIFYDHIFPFATVPSTVDLNFDPLVFPTSLPNTYSPPMESLLSTNSANPTSEVLPSNPSLGSNPPISNVPKVFPSAEPPCPPAPQSLPPTKTSSRVRHHPYLEDYSCLLIFTSFNPQYGKPYDISDSLSYTKLNPADHSFLTAASSHSPKPTIHQAVKHLEWRAAMDKENVALEQNHTWTLTTLPHGHVPIDVNEFIRLSTIQMAALRDTKRG